MHNMYLANEISRFQARCQNNAKFASASKTIAGAVIHLHATCKPEIKSLVRNDINSLSSNIERHVKSIIMRSQASIDEAETPMIAKKLLSAFRQDCQHLRGNFPALYVSADRYIAIKTQDLRETIELTEKDDGTGFAP